jgi:transposase
MQVSMPQTPTPPVFIGVDVAKAELVIAQHIPQLANKPRVTSVPNDTAAITAWLATLTPGSRIAMESTGRYHGLLAQLAQRAGHCVYVLNARDVYHYAHGLGVRGKTDRLDAQVIARYLGEHHAQLHPWIPPTMVQAQLDALLARRALLGKHQSSLRLSLKESVLDAIKDDVGQFLDQFDTLMARIDEQVQALIASDVTLAQGCARLCTISGIGPQISALLTSLFSRLAFANADALVAFCGLDPRPQDSGEKKGRRRLTKRGPALLRRQMWLAGFSATRSKAFKPIYQSLRARGLSTTAAIVILARKLLRIAFAVWKSGKPFDASRFTPVEKIVSKTA